MTNSDVVRVAVEIVDNFSDELTTLESRLEKIDGKTLDVDLDIDDSDIETVKGKLEALEEELNATLDIDVSGYKTAKAQKEDLERDMHSTLHLGVDKDNITGLGNLNGDEGFNPPELEELEKKLQSTLDIEVRGYETAKAQKEDLEDDIHSTLYINVDKDNLNLQDINVGVEKTDSGIESGNSGTGSKTLAGLESLDLADDVFDHTLENLRGFEDSSAEYADSVRRFSPEEQDVVNEWIINPDVAKAHNKGIPKEDRDGWIGPSNWGFGMGEKWGPEPRYPNDKKDIDSGTDFLRGVKEMTESWSELEVFGANSEPIDGVSIKSAPVDSPELPDSEWDKDGVTLNIPELPQIDLEKGDLEISIPEPPEGTFDRDTISVRVPTPPDSEWDNDEILFRVPTPPKSDWNKEDNFVLNLPEVPKPKWETKEDSEIKFDLGLQTGLGDVDSEKTAAQIDFLRGINTATNQARKLELETNLFDDAKFGDPEVQIKDIDSGLFAPLKGSGRAGQMGVGFNPYPEHMFPNGPSIPQRIGYRAGTTFQGLIEMPGFVKSGISKRISKRTGFDIPSTSGVLSSIGDSAVEGISMLTDEDGKRAPIISNLKDNLRKLVPSMQKWYRLVALVIPLLITMAGAALGAAAALGSLAGVGAAMVGIGLLGYGDSLSESLRNAQKRTQQLKEELFDVFQPVAGVFQPFVEQLFGKIPKVAGQLTEPLKDLEASGFDNFFIGALEGTGDFLADLIRLINQLAPEIQAIGAGLGRVFGDILLGLLQWSVKELYNNWEAFSRLGTIIIDLLVILYNLAKVVSFALSFFKPLFDILVGISNVFENRLSASILAGVAAMIALYYAASSVAAAFAIIKGSAIAQALYSGVIAAGSLTGALASVSMTLSTIIAQMTALNMLTGGVLLAAGAVVGYLAYQELKPETPSLPTGGTSSPSGFGSPSPTGGYGSGTQINIYGDVGRDEYQRLRDEFPDMYQEQSKIDEETER